MQPAFASDLGISPFLFPFEQSLVQEKKFTTHITILTVSCDKQSLTFAKALIPLLKIIKEALPKNKEDVKIRSIEKDLKKWERHRKTISDFVDRFDDILTTLKYNRADIDETALEVVKTLREALELLESISNYLTLVRSTYYARKEFADGKGIPLAKVS